MKRTQASIVLVALAACSSSSPAPGYTAAFQEAQDAAYEVLRAGDVASIGIALAARDRVVWAEGFGLADTAAARPATRTTRWGIGSVSKMFAAVAVMQLVERGKLELEAPLVRYVPSFQMDDPRYRDITVRMLLDHSSGLPGTTFRSGFTFTPALDYERTVVEALAHERLKAAPGSMSVYCNDGFTLVETLVAAVTGKSYADHVQQEILAPLGMTDSAFPLASFPDGSYARAYGDGNELPLEVGNMLAAGGLYSTPSDLATFSRVFLNGGAVGSTRILTSSSVEEMGIDRVRTSFNPVPNKGLAFGLGWDTVSDSALAEFGVEGWAKSGGSFFYVAHILVAPREGLATVVMAPKGESFSTLAIAQRVLLRALYETGRIPRFPQPLAPVAEPVAAAPAGLVASMEGIYASYTDILQLRGEADGSVSLLKLGPDGFQPHVAGLQHRTDGWFTSQASPLESWSVVPGAGTRFLAVRQPSGHRGYVDPMAHAQAVTARTAPLTAAWRARVARTWLPVNEHPDAVAWLVGDPRFSLTTTPELNGLVVAVPSFFASHQVLDPSASDQRASMMLVTPGVASRDLNDLEIVAHGSEEWVRWGAYLHRPMETVPVLAPAATTSVAIGPEGHAEWRAVAARTAPVTITISGGRSWRLYDPDFQLAGNGEAGGQAVLPAGTGRGHLIVYGAPGASVAVTSN